MNNLLKITREWIQWNCKDGDKIIFGSDKPLIDITPKKLEDFASYIIKNFKED